jgi:glutathione S-transferase
MKLYITAGSPYARITRIVIIEKGLEDRIDIVPAQTRLADSPYYRVNPSGRVPYLVRNDGVGMEESVVICRYLDHLDGKPQFDLPAGELEWETRRLGALASSLLDGLSVWGRENRSASKRAIADDRPPRNRPREANGRSLGDGDRASFDDQSHSSAIPRPPCATARSPKHSSRASTRQT